jgi:hypothetical protein
MNTTLQCLANTVPLVDYFLDPAYAKGAHSPS